MKTQMFSCPDGHRKELAAGVMGELCYCGKTMYPTDTRDKDPAKKVLRFTNQAAPPRLKKSEKTKRKKTTGKTPPAKK
jgi:hypothetical protein